MTARVHFDEFVVAGEETSAFSRWLLWSGDVENFLVSEDIVDSKRKKAKLLHWGGPELRRIHAVLEAGVSDDQDSVVGLEAEGRAVQRRLAEARIKLDDVIREQDEIDELPRSLDDVCEEFRAKIAKYAEYAMRGVRAACLEAELMVGALTNELEQIRAKGDVYKLCVARLTKYFKGSQSYRYQRLNFYKVKPESGESNVAYVTRLQSAVKGCDFENTEQTLLDMLLLHTKNNDLRREILKAGDSLTLGKAKELCRVVETTELQAKTIEGRSELDLTSSPQERVEPVYKLNFNNAAAINLKGGKKCFACGETGHFSRDVQCKGTNHKCKLCGKVGHLENVCWSKVEGASENITNFMFMVHKQGKAIQPDVTCKVGGVDVQFVIDSAAAVSVLSKSSWEAAKKGHIKGTCVHRSQCDPLFALGAKEPLRVLGGFDATIDNHGRSSTTRLYVVEDAPCNLLDRETAIKLGVLRVGNVPDTTESVMVSHTSSGSPTRKKQVDEDLPFLFIH